MEEKLKEIFESNLWRVDGYAKEEEKLITQLEFYDKHNLHEEKRITRLKYDELSKVLYRYKEMVNEVKELLDAWNS
jgi:hypothetical protein